MAQDRTQRFIIWSLLILYLVLVTISVFLQYFYEVDAYKPNENSSKLHGPLSLLGVIFCGVGLMIYRLFRGFRTRTIKYVHLFFQTIATVLLFVGYAFSESNKVRQFVGKNESGTTAGNAESAEGADFPTIGTGESDKFLVHIKSSVHVAVGYLMLGSILIQYFVGSFVFAYLYANDRLRLIVAPFHDIFGIWIFICLIATHLTGLCFIYETVGYWKPEERAVQSSLNILCLPTILGFLIVFIVVICPYLEWDLVGLL